MSQNIHYNISELKESHAIETGLELDIFAQDLPFTIEQILEPEFLPTEL